MIPEAFAGLLRLDHVTGRAPMLQVSAEIIFRCVATLNEAPAVFELDCAQSGTVLMRLYE